MQTMWTARPQTEVLPQIQHLLGCVPGIMPEEHIENVPPVVSNKTNVVNTNYVYDDIVSPQNSRTTHTNIFKITQFTDKT